MRVYNLIVNNNQLTAIGELFNTFGPTWKLGSSGVSIRRPSGTYIISIPKKFHSDRIDYICQIKFQMGRDYILYDDLIDEIKNDLRPTYQTILTEKHYVHNNTHVSK